MGTLGMLGSKFSCFLILMGILVRYFLVCVCGFSWLPFGRMATDYQAACISRLVSDLRLVCQPRFRLI